MKVRQWNLNILNIYVINIDYVLLMKRSKYLINN